MRGTLNKILKLSEQQRLEGVVCASTVKKIFLLKQPDLLIIKISAEK